MHLNFQRMSKGLLQFVIPAVSSLYFVLGSLFDFPAVEQVLGILAIFSLVLGLLLFVFGKPDPIGVLVTSQKEDGTILFSLELDEDPDVIAQSDIISFKVVSSPISHIYNDYND